MSSIISVHKSFISLKHRLKFTASSHGHKLVVISWVTLCFPWAQAQQQPNGPRLTQVWNWLQVCRIPQQLLSILLMHQHLGPTHLHFILKVISVFFTLSWVISCFYTMHHGALHEINFLIWPKKCDIKMWYFGLLNSNFTDSYPPGTNTLVILNKRMLFQ